MNASIFENSAPLFLEHCGCRLAYRVRGEGEPVLMIQGAGIHGDGWRPQIEDLSKGYRCLSFDNRGMSGSQPVGCRLTIEQMAEDALALMDAQSWESAHIVGHSMGGVIAQQLALSAPKRVRSLALLCTFARGRDATRLTWPILWLAIRTRIGTRRQRRRAFLKFVLPPGMLASQDQDALAESLAPIFGHDLADHEPIVMKQVAALGRFDARDRLHELKGIPTLVASSELDVIALPSSGRDLAARIPGAKFIEFAGATHGVPIHDSARINALLREHFAKADALRRSAD